MLRTLIMGTLALVAAASWMPSASAQDVEAYARLPEMQSVSISPDGESIAFISGAEREETVVIAMRLDGQGEPVVVEAASEDISEQLLFSVDWVSNTHLILTYRVRLLVPGAGAEEADIGRLVIFDLRDREFLEVEIAAVSIADTLPEDPEHVLLSGRVLEINTTQNSFTASRGRDDGVSLPVNLLEFNIETGRTRIVSEGSQYTVNWVLGPDAEPVLRQDFDTEDRTWRVFERNGRGWRQIFTERYTSERFGRTGRRSLSRIDFFSGLDVDGRGVWFATRENRDKFRGYLFDPEAAEISGPHIAPDRFDMTSFVYDPYERVIVGAVWMEERLQYEWFAEPFAGIHRQLQEMLPDSDIQIADWSLDRQRFIVQVNGGQASTDYYLLDRSTGEMSFLQTQYPEIAPGDIHPVSIVEYQARDGLDLWGYLTTPRGRELESLPMILLPHGGPQARDTYRFDHWSQFLAEMGYAVFQPQFRGGEGMGRNFIMAGHGEWGRLMQSDLTDAVQHLADVGVADPDRVCIFGWSYGGYAALAGYALTPEVYRCVIAGAPVSDILEMMEYEEDTGGGAAVNYWTEYIGDWRTQRDLMISISPARNVVRSDLPLMLIHGEEDLIVPIEQAEIMADRMREAGNPVDFVRIPGDGHNLLFKRTRAITLESLQRFLSEHNPPDPQ
jgi:dipeptidyl aminopeptidase/acylaminoacyl peptidase